MSNIEKKYNELKDKINYYASKYYNDDAPEISDFEYDMLMVELRNIEKEHPELIAKDSPTQVIVATGKVNEKFSEVTHEVPLQSLQDVFNLEDIQEFLNRVEKEVDKIFDLIEENKEKNTSNEIIDDEEKKNKEFPLKQKNL